MNHQVVYSREQLAAAIQCVEDEACEIIYHHRHGQTVYRFPANTVEVRRVRWGPIPITNPAARVIKRERRRDGIASRARRRIKKGT